MEKSKPRVLVVTSVFPRWAEDATPPFVQNQCELMVRAGWEVMVLAPHAKGARFEEVVNGVRVVRYAYAWPFSLQQLCYAGGMLIRMKKQPWTKSLLLPLYFSQLVSLLYFAWKWKPGLLHSHSLLPQGLSATWVSILLRIPHVTTSHGNDVFGLKSTGLMGALKRQVLRRADAITVNSSATAAAVQQLGAPTDKLCRIPAVPNESAVDEVFFAKIREQYAGEGACVLFVGRLIKEKGVVELLHAMATLIQETPDLRCVIVGEGVLRAELEHLANELSIAKSVYFAGWRAREEISTWMAAADVLAVPSQQLNGWQEAQGLVVVEAMAVGTPVVAARNGGIPDMIQEGETGYLFEPDRPDEFLSALRRALNVEDRSAMAKRQRARFDAEFSARAVGSAMSTVYATLTQSANTAEEIQKEVGL